MGLHTYFYYHQLKVMFYHLGIHFLRAAKRLLRQQKKFNIHLKSVRLESGEWLVLPKIYINALDL